MYVDSRSWTDGYLFVRQPKQAQFNFIYMFLFLFLCVRFHFNLDIYEKCVLGFDFLFRFLFLFVFASWINSISYVHSLPLKLCTCLKICLNWGTCMAVCQHFLLVNNKKSKFVFYLCRIPWNANDLSSFLMAQSRLKFQP